MWHALAEFVDNSTQSKFNYDGIITGVLNDDGVTLTVEINYDRAAKTLTVKDNSIGMTKSKLIEPRPSCGSMTRDSTQHICAAMVQCL